MKSIYSKLAMVMAAAVVFASCEKEPEQTPNEPDVPVTPENPEGKVTLTLRSAQTKTLLSNETTVVWEEGDEILVNDKTYVVQVNPDDPSVATVADVAAAEKYVAVYPDGGGIDDLYVNIPYQQAYTQGTFASKTNPMVASSTTTDLSFYNLGSVLRLSLTGNGEELSGLILKSNTSDDRVSGSVKIPLSMLEAKNFDNISIEGYHAQNHVEVLFPEPLRLASEPAYIYIVLPNTILPGGFTVSLANEDSGLAEITTDKRVVMERSKVMTMDNVACTFGDEIVFGEPTFDESGAVILHYEKKEDMKLRYAAFDKAGYDEVLKKYPSVRACNRALMEKYSEEWSDNLSYPYTNALHIISANYLSGTSEEPALLAADTEYVVLASYNKDTYDFENPEDSKLFGGVVTKTFRTPKPTGEPPVLNIEKVSVPNEWTNAKFSFTTESASGFMEAANVPLEIYEKLAASGKSDKEILKSNLTHMESYDNVGCANIYVTGNYADTEYVLMAMATSVTGMETIKKYEYKTDTYEHSVIGDNVAWKVVSEEASLECGFLAPGQDGKAVVLTGLKVEANENSSFYRIENLMSVAKNPVLADYGFSDLAGTSYVYIDARENGELVLEVLANKLNVTSQEYACPYLGNSEMQTNGSLDAETGIMSIRNLALMDKFGEPGTVYNDYSYLHLNIKHEGGDEGDKKDGVTIEDFVVSDNVIEW